MSKNRLKPALLAAGLLLAASAAVQAAPVVTRNATPATTNPASGLYTSYTVGTTGVNFVVCGYLPDSDGCYGSGGFGPFGQVGAVIEGAAQINAATGTVWRNVYILDQSVGGGTSTATALYTYRITEIVNGSSASITSSEIGSPVTLPLVGGSTAKSYMAGVSGSLFIGSDQSNFAVRFEESNSGFIKVGPATPPGNVSAITVNQAGYGLVFFGGPSGKTDYYQFGPLGQYLGEGTGGRFTLGTTQGLGTPDLPGTASAFVPDLTIHYQQKTK